METKFVEIRDRATTIPALAIQIMSTDGWLARRAGFGEEGCILLINLNKQDCRWDPYDWDQRLGRTMHVAHVWLTGHWEAHVDGGVIDVEYILGERPTPKVSEQHVHA